MSKRMAVQEQFATVAVARGGFSGRARRPIDKKLIVINQSITNAQTSTTLLTVTFPCTVVGLRWDVDLNSILTAGASSNFWAIVVVRDGVTTSTMATSDGADLFTPEQDVLVFGCYRSPDADLGGGPVVKTWQGSTKTMRKLMGGDTLRLIGLGTTATTGTLLGVVQFFCKT